MEPMEEIETMCRSILQKAGSQEYTLSQAEPEELSVDYRSGYAAGRLAGQMSTAALMLGIVTGESPSTLLDNARAQAKIENAFPFDLHIDSA